MTVLRIRVGILAVAFFSLTFFVACGGGATGGNNGGGGSTTPSVTSVTVNPTHAEMSAAGAVATTQQFNANVTVTGGAASAVTWSVNGIVGGNSSVGTITANGLYTPPSTFLNPTTVTATSTA